MTGFDRECVAGPLATDTNALGLRIELVDVTAEEIVIALEVLESHTNFLGGGHGVMVFSLADCAFSLVRTRLAMRPWPLTPIWSSPRRVARGSARGKDEGFVEGEDTGHPPR